MLKRGVEGMFFGWLLSLTLLVGGALPTPAAYAQAALKVSGIEAPNIVHRVGTIADLRGMAGNTGKRATYVEAHTAAGDGYSGNFRWVSGAESGAYEDNDQTVIVPASSDGSAAWLMVSGRVISNLDVKIPSDYPTLQLAIDGTAGRILTGQGVSINLLVESGHALTHGMMVKNGDYSHYTISCEDAEVPLAEGFVGVTGESTQPNSIIVGDHANMPTLDCLINANDLANAGYMAINKSTGKVNRNKGVIYAKTLGLYLASSTVHASGANFSYADRGSRATANSILHAEGINLSNSRGLYAAQDDVFALDVSRGSLVYVMSQSGNVANLTNSAGRGLSARRSWVTATLADVSGAALDGVRSELGAHIVFSAGNAQNCGQNGVFATAGGTVAAPEANTSGAGQYGFYANSGASIEAATGVANNCGIGGVYARLGSRVNISGGTIAGSIANGIFADDGSAVNASSATVTTSGSRGAYANAGSTINVRAATITGSADKDIRISRGSFITANDATTTNSTVSAPIVTDTNVSAFNAISGSSGIIWGN